MASSLTVIGNMSLSHIGIGKLIGSLDERSDEARALKMFHLEDLKQVLEALDWPFARKYVELGQVEEEPNDEWLYSYRYPADCVAARKILTGIRLDSPDAEVPFELSSDDSGRLIFTDLDDAQLKYTRMVSDTSLFSATFTRAYTYKLANSVAARLTGGDPYKLGDKMFQYYTATIAQAAAAASKEDHQGPQPESEFIRGRE